MSGVSLLSAPARVTPEAATSMMTISAASSHVRWVDTLLPVVAETVSGIESTAFREVYTGRGTFTPRGKVDAVTDTVQNVAK